MTMVFSYDELSNGEHLCSDRSIYESSLPEELNKLKENQRTFYPAQYDPGSLSCWRPNHFKIEYGNLYTALSKTNEEKEGFKSA